MKCSGLLFPSDPQNLNQIKQQQLNLNQIAMERLLNKLSNLVTYHPLLGKSSNKHFFRDTVPSWGSLLAAVPAVIFVLIQPK
jgi:hypothetical protein